MSTFSLQSDDWYNRARQFWAYHHLLRRDTKTGCGTSLGRALRAGDLETVTEIVAYLAEESLANPPTNPPAHNI